MHYNDIESDDIDTLIKHLLRRLRKVNIFPLGIHRISDAIEFALVTKPEDEVILRNFYIIRNGVHTYLLKADEEFLIVNLCGYDFREHISDICKQLTFNSRVIHHYRQKRKYGDHYIDSGTITFWVKNIHRKLETKIDKRRRCYFDTAQHDSLLSSSPPVSNQGLSSDDDMSQTSEKSRVLNMDEEKLSVHESLPESHHDLSAEDEIDGKSLSQPSETDHDSTTEEDELSEVESLPESHHDLVIDEDNATTDAEVTLDADPDIPADDPATEARGLPAVDTAPTEEPPVKRLAIASSLLKPDIAPGGIAGASLGSVPAARVTSPPPVTQPNMDFVYRPTGSVEAEIFTSGTVLPMNIYDYRTLFLAKLGSLRPWSDQHIIDGYNKYKANYDQQYRKWYNQRYNQEWPSCEKVTFT